MTDSRPILFGEILFDHFPDGTATLGGAPLNVAAHLAGLGERPVLVSRVGADAEGERARDELARRGVDLRAVQLDTERPTGAVRVELAAGEPSFDILERRAWDAIDADTAVASLRGILPSVLYHGVLSARSPTSRSALQTLRALAAPSLFVDVNLRPPWTPVERALDLCGGAAWLKVNDRELAELAGIDAGGDDREVERAARLLLAHSGASRLVVTRGERGATLYVAGEAAVLAVTSVPATGAGGDPVGAGDAFSAVMLVGALRGWPAQRTLQRAAELAAAVCALRGALPSDSGWHAPFRRNWEAT